MAELQELPGETPPDGTTESMPNDPDSKAQLEHFAAEATAKYAIKDYDAAAELFSQATELQARTNGEMSPQNADLLYAYGRCLYHLALRNSDVLGPKVAGEAQAEESKASGSKKQSNQSKSAAPADEPATGDASSNGTDVKNNGAHEDSGLGGKKPLFQFTGDENFDDSDDEDELASGGANGKEGGEAEEDPEDDFANAYEVLDLARILLLKRIEELHDQEGVLGGKGKGKANTSSEAMHQLKERLADTHDLQAEISLEGERFPAAVTDLKAALDLKKELFPESSSLVAEAHYKLSLALEFSSVTRQKDPEGGENGENQVQQVDVAMREEAANEMEAAIQSCKLRIQVELARLNSGGEDKGGGQHCGKKVTKVDIDDVKDMVEEMEQRLLELRQSPLEATATSEEANSSPRGIMGSILGESPAAQQEKLNEASINANDLTGLIKRSGKKGVTTTTTTNTTNTNTTNTTTAAAGPGAEMVHYENSNGNGKRKMEFDDEIVDVGSGKKARLSDED